MGRNHRPWRAHAKAQPKKWEYWPGTWRSPRYTKPNGAGTDKTKPCFPAYDAVPADSSGIVAGLAPSGHADAPSVFLLVQTAVIHIRCLDVKHARLQKDLKEKHLCWERYVASMKQSLKQERLRHQQLLEVSEEQAAAHQQLGGIVPGGAKAMGNRGLRRVSTFGRSSFGQGWVRSDRTWRRLCRRQCPHHHTPKPLSWICSLPLPNPSGPLQHMRSGSRTLFRKKGQRVCGPWLSSFGFRNPRLTFELGM